MTVIDDIFYYSCCFIVVLHSLSALLVITHGRCTVYAAAFLIASAMWLSLSVLNLWFFLPTVVQDAAELVRGYEAPPYYAGDGSFDCLWRAAALLRAVVFGSAASYFYMMLFGWFVGAMSLSNALTMWQREGCDAVEPHGHSSPAATWLLRAAHRVEGWVAIEDPAAQLPRWEKEEEEASQDEKTTTAAAAGGITKTTMTTEEKRAEEVRRVRKGGSFLFAVPRRLHSCYMLLLAPQVKLPAGSGRQADAVETSEKGEVL
ncbi:hypothetical protein PG994_005543 [Apiospora phragmitis]|uniref:Uncharacterized protein n=1 Tax=Apiospora phragmitis TaxID=2905665 RepID=A0ABR1VCI8_9PEZI